MTGSGAEPPGPSLADLARIVGGRPAEGSGELSYPECAAVASVNGSAGRDVIWFAQSEAALAGRRPGIVVEQPVVAADVGNRVLAARREWTGAGPPAGPFPHARVDASAFVAPGCFVGRDTVLEAGVVLGPGCVIGPSVVIGRGTVLGPNCTVRGTVLGPGCEVGESVVLGADPSSFRAEPGGLRRHGTGSLRIETQVRIGPRTVVERGAEGDTTLGAGALVFGDVYIAHDVGIGREAVLVASSSFASGAVLEDGVVVYGASAVAQDVRIGAGAMVLGGSHVTRQVASGARVRGQPARPMEPNPRAADALQATAASATP